MKQLGDFWACLATAQASAPHGAVSPMTGPLVGDSRLWLVKNEENAMPICFRRQLDDPTALCCVALPLPTSNVEERGLSSRTLPLQAGKRSCETVQ